MFTGLVERLGRVETLTPPTGNQIMTLKAAVGPDYPVQLGDSVAVNGCCLTVTQSDGDVLAFDVSHETLSRTNLGALTVGSHVNLERAMRLGDRLGGHLVSGHIDGLARLQAIKAMPQGWDVLVELPPSLSRYVIDKGSITLDGVSLTINDLEDQPGKTIIRLTLIPKTLEMTTFGQLQPGWDLNVEVDLTGKYLERLVTHQVSAAPASR